MVLGVLLRGGASGLRLLDGLLLLIHLRAAEHAVEQLIDALLLLGEDEVADALRHVLRELNLRAVAECLAELVDVHLGDALLRIGRQVLTVHVLIAQLLLQTRVALEVVLQRPAVDGLLLDVRSLELDLELRDLLSGDGGGARRLLDLVTTNNNKGEQLDHVQQHTGCNAALSSCLVV